MLSNNSKTADYSSGQGTSKYAKNKGVTTSKTKGPHSSNVPSKVSVDDSTNTANVPNSDKLNNKLSNKPKKLDTDLAEIVQTWPRLPKDIQSAILTLVRTTSGATG